MDERFIAKQIAIGRILFGILMIAAPRLVLRRSAPDAPGPAIFFGRIFGVRDVALGAGTLVALESGDAGARRWVAVSAAADTADIATALVRRDELGREGVIATMVLAVPAAVGGWLASLSLGGDR